MTIVPLGSMSVQVPENGSLDFEMELAEQIKLVVPQIIGRVLEESLETEVERMLKRKRYKRRRKGDRQQIKAYCSRCRSHRRADFQRNGHYERQLDTHWGSTSVNVPQVRCQCKGNVRLTFQTIRPRQRIWEDLEHMIRVEYGRGLSYRQIKVDLDERLGGSVGLRTLNQRILTLGSNTGHALCMPKGAVPPVVRVDGIWITVMFATGEVNTDQLGRQRPQKQARKVPILAAQGIWPETGRTQLLAWMLAESEDTASWQTFLERLYEGGLTSENGLKLLVADGSTGFRAAYENVYWQTPLQRCVFHKLRNLAQAIRPPAELDRQSTKAYRTSLLRSAAQIWQASEEFEARERYTDFCQTWQTKQPKVVQTLSQDFELTLTFFIVQEQAAALGECWPAHHLRTTSPLERLFREFRQRYRRAVLFHSPAGLSAVTRQLAARFS
jgi:transposase-like protein